MNVLITGGAGFLGRGILRRTRRDLADWRVTVYSRDETKQDVCRQRYPEHRYILGDVLDTERLAAVAAGHDLIIHAAAMKYVPDAELNAAECVRVNVDGTRSVIAAALRGRVANVVGISTDKAVRPINVYGMSKAIMERLFAEVAHTFDTTFTAVRYGNVVGSTGSVIPLFQRQLREQGYLTVTNPGMTRFWMSIDEAIDCILYAVCPERISGSVTVPRPAAMTLGGLAETIAAGMPIKVTGPRPGEKEHEELLHYQESVRAIDHLRNGYYEVVPIAHPILERFPGVEPFTLASHTPAAGWVTRERMREMIEDAADV